MKTTFLFPGQGSQYPGMGKSLADRFSPAREVFEEADRALGFSLSTLCFEGPAEALQLTENTQPALLANDNCWLWNWAIVLLLARSSAR